MKLSNKINQFLHKQVSIAPLVVFRIVFGALLLYSTLRTIQKGWVQELYVQPTYHFSFVSWAQPLGASGMQAIFIILSIAAFFMLIGLFYRGAAITYFALFTYCELIDKTYYLNHYYLVSLLTFWLIFVPANRCYSIDALLFPKIRSTKCSNWHILIFKFQLSVVYFFAGLAKVNSDWLFRAQPMATWLPGKYQIPIIGPFMHLKWVAFFFSWCGCAYDLTIWIFLWIKKTRGIAYCFVIIFHVLTGILFPRIGMFPFIMVSSTIIFFSAAWHERVLSFLPFAPKFQNGETLHVNASWQKQLITTSLIFYCVVQLYMPMRYLQYGDNLFWHERGYRFSWRVMLMEKNGLTSIIVKDPQTQTQKEVNQARYLTPFQMQQMRSQPDMLLQFAKHIGDEFVKEKGYAPEVYVKSRISLNARRSQPFTNDTLDVYSVHQPFKQHWIQPLNKK